MEDLSGSRAHDLTPAGLAAALSRMAGLGLLAPSAARAQPPDVSGAWHVLVHYQDTASSTAGRLR